MAFTVHHAFLREYMPCGPSTEATNVGVVHVSMRWQEWKEFSEEYTLLIKCHGENH